MRINQNVSALNAYRNMVMTDNRLNKSLERLSSGLRINRAADDAAGLAISEKMRGQIRGLNQAMSNAQDGISLIQTAEGALNETHSILQRMRELSVQAANDTLTSSDRMEIQKEINQLTEEIDRIANTTEFNTKKLLDGTTSALTSSDKLSTKIFMRDGLRTIDQFGQKAVGGGNYKLEIEANPGLGQVQKTDIMKIKHPVDQNVIENENVGNARYQSGDIAVLNGNSSGASAALYTFTLNLDHVDDPIVVTQRFDMATDGTTTSEAQARAFVDAINNDAVASNYFQATAIDTDGTIFQLRIDHIEAPDSENVSSFNLEIGVNYNPGPTGFTSTAGLLELTPTEYSANNQNITTLGEPDGALFVAGGYAITTDADLSAAGAQATITVMAPEGAITGTPGLTLTAGSVGLDGNDYQINVIDTGSSGLQTAYDAESKLITVNLGGADATATEIVAALDADLPGIGVSFTAVDGTDTFHTVTAASDTNTLTSAAVTITASALGDYGGLSGNSVEVEYVENATVGASGSVDFNATTQTWTIEVQDATTTVAGLKATFNTYLIANSLTTDFEIGHTGDDASTFLTASNLQAPTAMTGGLNSATIAATNLEGGLDATPAAAEYSQYSQSGSNIVTGVTADVANVRNISLQMEVQSISGNNVTVAYTWEGIGKDGVAIAGTSGTVALAAGGNVGGTLNTEIGGSAVFGNFNLSGVGNFTVGDKVVVNVNAVAANDDDGVSFYRDDSAVANFVFANNTAINSTETTFNFYQLDLDENSSTYGQVYNSSIDLTFGELKTFRSTDLPAASFDVAVRVGDGIGNIASKDTKINDIDRFWDASGNNLVENPQTITLVQGNGEQTSFTIFKTDSIGDIETKLNNAIHVGLGQKTVDGTTATSYAQYVAPDKANDDGYFSVEGTFIIQSAITGKDGEITFVGNDQVINALSLTTIQQSSESLYTVNVTDAHSGEVIAEDVKISGNMLVATVHKNVDVKFDAMAGIDFEAEADGEYTEFGWDQSANAHTTYVHLADNTQVFHIGANPLQDIGASIGNMRSDALGIDNILVTNRAAANSAIATIDDAIGRVSSERSKMGALQNRLEHTINNLGVSAENLTAAESRIRDLDFAMEMIEFTRNQIMMQAGTSMLAQANMKPQSVLMLLG